MGMGFHRLDASACGVTVTSRKALGVILSAASLLLAVRPALGTTYSPVALRRCVAAADIIVAGTVESITPRRIDGSIVSEIRLRNLRFLRGFETPRGDSLVLRNLGGWLGGKGLINIAGPEFREGERCVLLLKSGLGTHRDLYSPVVYFNQGFFPVFADSGSAAPTVHDWLRRPILAVVDGRIISVQPPIDNEAVQKSAEQERHGRALTREELAEYALRIPKGAPVILLPYDLDPGVRLSADQFLVEVRKLMSER